MQILFIDDLDGSEAARSGSKAGYDETQTAGKVMHKKLISIAALAPLPFTSRTSVPECPIFGVPLRVGHD
jgi:hypothetical protein